MKGQLRNGSMLAAAVAVFSTTAYAQQTDCNQQIRQLEEKIQQRQVDQRVQTEIQDLILAAEENPIDCNSYIARAEELLRDPDQTRTTQATQQSGQQQQTGQSVDKASELMGQSLLDDQGEEIGTIEDFAVTMEDGKLAYVVVSTGGMFSKKKIGLPADKLQPATEGEGYVTSVSSQELESAESLPPDQWPVQPTLGGQTGGGGTAQPASELIGQAVQDSQGNNLGQIDDFALDIQQGKLAYVVLSTGGGVMGMGDGKLIGVPASALQPAQNGFVASISQQQLEQAQDLPENDWPEQPTIASAPRPEGAGGVQQSSLIRGQTVTNRQGEALGQIEEFALDMQKGELAYVAIRTAEGKQIGIPADRLEEAQQGEGYVADISTEELQSAQELPPENWPETASLTQSASGTSSETRSGARSPDFSSLDHNQDGYISEDEARQSSQELAQDFQQIDRNSDRQIDRTEFAAFEQKQQ